MYKELRAKKNILLSVKRKVALIFKSEKKKKTSLLRRLQAQTLPDATPPIGKNPSFSNMAVTFEPVMQF